MALEVLIGAPVAVPAGVDEHRLAAQVVGERRHRRDGAGGGAGDADDDGSRGRRALASGQLGEVLPVGDSGGTGLST